MDFPEFEGLDTTKYTIQVVDDIAINTRLLEKILSKFNFNVKVYNNSNLAFDSIATDAPQVILLDCMMPGIDGMTYLRQMREDPRFKDIRVIMVSAVSESSEIAKAFTLGANDYLTKPINIKKLTSVLAAQLREYEGLKQN